MHRVCRRLLRLDDLAEGLLVARDVGGKRPHDPLHVARAGDDAGADHALRRHQVDEVEDELLARVGDAQQVGVAPLELLVGDLDADALRLLRLVRLGPDSSPPGGGVLVPLVAVGRILRFFSLPVADLLRGQQRVLRRGSDLAWLLGGLLAGWWVYVPIHELLHAAGCLAAGGAVSRLEIDTIYGGALLARVFPWVVAGSDYAGRLSGFDTRGSDAIYLVTDLLPFV